jgi:tungstate transport system substrate-binding protein
MRRILLALLLTSAALFSNESGPPVRAAVIGGMTMSGLWQEVARAFEAAHHIPVEIVVTGPKRVLDAYCRREGVDLVTMHASDTIVNLAADGYFDRLTPWARNAQMLVGHRSDPADLASAESLKEALDRLSTSEAPFLVHASGGTFEVFSALRADLGWRPSEKQVRFTTAKRGFLRNTAEMKGYTLYGTIPFLMRKQHDAEITGFFFNDPALRRPYLAAVGTEARIGRARRERAELLRKFLTSPRVQTLIERFRIKGFESTPVFFPATPPSRR